MAVIKMNMAPIELICLCIVILTISPTYAGQYTVVAGKSLRPMSEFRAAVTRSKSNIDDGGGAVLLEVLGRGFREAQQLTLQPGSTTVATFKIGALNPGAYNLTVRSTAGREFQASAPLYYANKTYCVFVHTDKTVYKPGEMLQFRLLLLNMYLKPLPDVRPQLTLKDGNGNIVRQWKSVPLTKGVFSSEVQIADFPTLGDWTFETELQGQLYVKRVLVADFVLPKFNLNIEVPKHIYLSDGSFTVTVTAEQFSGQDVTGELTVTAYPVFYSGVIQPIFQAPSRKVLNIEGKSSVEIGIASDLGLEAGAAAVGAGNDGGPWRRVVVEAAVEEALTGRRHNVSSLLLLHRNRQDLKYDAPPFYKPLLPYTLQVKVSDWEDTGSKDLGSVKVRYSFSGEGEKIDKMVESEHALNANGNLMYTFYPDPVSNQSTMNIEISYKEQNYKIMGIVASYSSSENFIQASLLSATPTVGSEVHVRVNCTEPLRSFTYHILGRGEIIFAKTVPVAPARRVEDFRFQATQAMAPEAILIISYVTDSGQLIASSIRFGVEGVLQNHVEIKIQPENPEPLGNLDISVAAEPDSYVALMANAPSPDFSIATDHHYMAGQGDGLTMDQIVKELRMFSRNHESLRHAYKEIGGSVTGEAFDKSGVVLITDNLVNYRHPLGKDENEFERNLHEDSTRPPLAGPYAFSRLPAPYAPRLHLGQLPTPTWLFTNITLGSEGNGVLGRRVSADAGSTWSVGGWAIHRAKGLGLANAAAATRSATRPRLAVALPVAMKSGEGLAMPVTFTPRPGSQKGTEAEITLHNSGQEFTFEDPTNEVDTSPKLELYRRQKVSAAAGRSATAVFFISVPRVEEQRTITLQFTATGMGTSETIERELTIYPDGEEEHTLAGDLLDLSSGPKESNLTVHLKRWAPRARDRANNQSSLHETILETVVTGSILAPALQRLPRALDAPPANGYDNMQAFSGTVLLYQALEASGQSSEAVKFKAIDVMQLAYQQQLAYRQPDGSFSIKPHRNEEGSVWVTGNAARWLGAGLKIDGVGIQPSVVHTALKWLAMKQKPDGHWQETADSQRDDNVQQNEVTLTAITLQAFLDTKYLTMEEYSNVGARAQDWLARNVERANEAGPVILAPLAAVLHRAGHAKASQAIDLLTATSNSSDGRRWWETSGEMFRSPALGRDAWTSEWALRALLPPPTLATPPSRAAIEVARALLGSTQSWDDPLTPGLADLAVALPHSTRAQVEFRCPSADDKTAFNIDARNSLFVQKGQVRRPHCEVSATGQGVVLAGVRAWRRTNVTGAWPRFTLDPRVDAVSTAHHLQLTTCVGFVVSQGEETSGPVLMDVRLPSGFEFDLDLPALLAGGIIRSTRSSGGQVRMALSPLSAREKCITLRAARRYAVSKEKPGFVKVLDLADQSRRARVFFTAHGGGPCDVCAGAWCAGACGSAQRQFSPNTPTDYQQTTKTPSGAMSLLPSTILTSLIIFSHLLAKILN